MFYERAKQLAKPYTMVDRWTAIQAVMESGVYWFQPDTMTRATMVEVLVTNGELTGVVAE